LLATLASVCKEGFNLPEKGAGLLMRAVPLATQTEA